MNKFCLLLVAMFVVVAPSNAQELHSEVLKVYIDCGRDCDFDYIRREIPYVNYVNDRVGADVHVLVSTENSGAGRQYEIEMIGLGPFVDISELFTYSSSATDTRDERRNGLTDTIRRGLTHFLLHTRLAERMEIQVFDQDPDVESGQQAAQPVDDPWDFWVFDVGLSGDVSGESNENEWQINSDFGANRTTEEWKFNLDGRFNYEVRNLDVDGRTVTNTQREGNLFGLLVNSIGDHWGVGITTFNNTSIRNNTDLSLSLSPTVEYNVFPYQESSRREFTFQYELNFRHFNYQDTTVFDKTEETLVQQQLSIRLNQRQPWGYARIQVEAQNYITDFERSMLDLYNVSFEANLNVRLFRGFSLDVGGEISRIKDQISLPKRNASEEDILLGRIRLPTSFDYSMEIGLNYRFGSIYNNVVNTRF